MRKIYVEGSEDKLRHLKMAIEQSYPNAEIDTTWHGLLLIKFRDESLESHVEWFCKGSGCVIRHH